MKKITQTYLTSVNNTNKDFGKNYAKDGIRWDGCGGAGIDGHKLPFVVTGGQRSLLYVPII